MKNPDSDPQSECRKYFQAEQKHYSCLRHFASSEEAKYFKPQLESKEKHKNHRIWKAVNRWHVGVA